MSEEFIDNICNIVGHAITDDIACSRCMRVVPELLLQRVIDNFAGFKVTPQTALLIEKDIIHCFKCYGVPCENVSVKMNTYNSGLSIELRSGEKVITGGTF